MGKVIKKILGDHEVDPYYNELIIEDNDDGRVHIHLKNIRLDMKRSDFNRLREVTLFAQVRLKEFHGWK